MWDWQTLMRRRPWDAAPRNKEVFPHIHIPVCCAVVLLNRRQQAANRAYQERLRSVDPAVHYSPNAPHPTKPMGAVPDFNGLHRQWEVQMARARANIRKRITVPQEFRLNGADLSEQAARVRRGFGI